MTKLSESGKILHSICLQASLFGLALVLNPSIPNSDSEHDFL